MPTVRPHRHPIPSRVPMKRRAPRRPLKWSSLKVSASERVIGGRENYQDLQDQPWSFPYASLSEQIRVDVYVYRRDLFEGVQNRVGQDTVSPLWCSIGGVGRNLYVLSDSCCRLCDFECIIYRLYLFEQSLPKERLAGRVQLGLRGFARLRKGDRHPGNCFNVRGVVSLTARCDDAPRCACCCEKHDVLSS